MFRRLTTACVSCIPRVKGFTFNSRCAEHRRWKSSDTTSSPIPLGTLLIANRGEIACRIIRTAKAWGVPTVAVYSDIEEDAQHVRMADRAVRIGAAAPAESYLNIPRLLQAAAETGAKAVHPGYGFLSENAEFAGAVTNAGLRFVGPSAETMAVMGDKRQAKLAMEAAGVPVVPGYHGEGSDAAALAEEARRVGFPLLIKAVMGGGGKGMKLVHQPAQLEEAVASAQREAQAAFGDARLLLERFIQRPRHIEVQIVAEAGGRNVVDVFERDCSVQRRHQKVLEEAPAPCLDADTRSTVRRLAVEAAKAVGYENAGTVEFILDTDTGELFFMEMNTRLQVEHPVSEMVAGIDLVEWQLRAAAGLSLPLQQLPAEPQGHAIEARVYAENPQRSFLPGAGRLRRWRLPRGAALLQDAPTAEAAAREVVRVDSGLREGDEVGVSYDPLLAKVICHAGSRGAALTGLEAALAQLQVAGVANNVQLLRDVLRHPDFQRGGVGTHFLQDHLQQLLAVPPAPAKVQAIAAALLWWLQAQAASSADAASAPSPAMSAWLAPDALRLHHLHSEATTVQEDHGADTGPDAAQLMLTIASPDRLLVSSASHAEAGIGGVCVRKLDLGADWAVLDVDGERCSLDFSWFQHSERQQLDMWRDGQHYSFCIPHPRFELQGRDGSSSSSAVLSPMPGRITKVLVRDGQAVDQGQTVVVMEAMKMETPLKAPSSGSLQLLVAEGQQVEVDQLLFRVGNTAKEDAQH